jgi:hypothetical protein
MHLDRGGLQDYIFSISAPSVWYTSKSYFRCQRALWARSQRLVPVEVLLPVPARALWARSQRLVPVEVLLPVWHLHTSAMSAQVRSALELRAEAIFRRGNRQHIRD